MRAKRIYITVAAVMLVVPRLISPQAWAQTFQVLHAFTWASGPSGALAMDAAGNLYGTTQAGGGTGCGGHGCGTIWKMTPNANGTWATTTLHVFSGADGNPVGGVILDGAGNLFGTTSSSDLPKKYGVVFELKLTSGGNWAYSVLHAFGFSDGARALGSLVLDTVGNLYGTTAEGGLSTGYCAANSCGVVFKLAPNRDGTWTESVIHEFNGQDGSFPAAGLTFDAAGNLYGTSANNVFKLTPNTDGSWSFTILHAFVGLLDGVAPNSLVFDAAGNLYGTTEGGGIKAGGTVFKLAPNADSTWSESILESFGGSQTSANGNDPMVGLAFDAAGNLWGTTKYGGCGAGIVFKLTPTSGGWNESIAHIFWGYAAFPLSPLLVGPSGRLFGTAFASVNNGIVFEVSP